ncbi:MAG: sugar phosphate isomerase/epimerase [Oscillospiraceae bacterium]|nr:sugar phosphate isomerase/epimerase [Oscillospiraceae bacterium]
MSKAKIGSPLFILREECKKDLMAVLGELSEIGYEGIEFLGLFGHKPSEIKSRLDSCGLAAIGDHVGFGEFAENTDKVIAEHKEIGCAYITVGAPGPDGLPGGASYPETIDTYERIGETMKAAKMKLLFHNHAGELKYKVKGKTILENIFDDTRPDLLQCEPDLGWIAISGADPAYYLQKYKDRCPVIHFKDYIPAKTETGFMFRPTGYGAMDNAGLYALSLGCRPDWYIMDHDFAYGRDPYFDLKISLEYFRSLMAVTDLQLTFRCVLP